MTEKTALSKLIEEFLRTTSRSLPRPDLTDKTTRKMLAGELASRIQRGK